ncbi:O-antigen ligase family protein [Rhodococcus qingshengii]|uniref:O-antigen ligase family protein n=1 Tax=Rhodococcus qingshengii TaxID=334542 RepID=UPI001C5E85D8|nr:O-antigen ligase family protein [Rhodococcus qingshengii]MBW4813356.1 O-antigen ligase family protein [Rhodococcus qingshengii]
MWKLAVAFGVLIVLAAGSVIPTLTIAALLGVCMILALRGRWYLLPAIALFLAATTLPFQVPSAIGVGGFSFRLYEPILAAAFGWALTRRDTLNRLPKATLALLLTMVGLGIVVALLGNASPIRIIGDVRFVIETAMAALVAAVVVRDQKAKLASAKSMRASLWISAAFTLLASAGVVTLSGRSEAANLDQAAGADAATRILAAATFFALATLCVSIAAAVVGKLSMRATWTWWGPALLILFLAFSRNHLVGIAVTILVALVAARSFTRSTKTLYVAAWAALAIVAIAALSPLISDLPGGAWIDSQVQSYSSRVLEGFDSAVTSTDSSTVYRDMEIAKLQVVVEDSPLIGHGYGFAYQRPIGQRGTFFYERAPYYSHNFYWWTLAKTGVVGLLLFLAAALSPLVVAMRDSSPGWGKAFAATLGGLLAVCWVAPLPIDAPSSAVIGAILGCTAGLASTARRSGYAVSSSPQRASSPDTSTVISPN